mgnify:FL=1
MNKAVTVLHCDRFCIIIANCPSPHCDRHSALSLAQHHILASLVKGEVLSPEKIRATTGGIASPLSLACTNLSKTALSHPLFVG